MNRPTKIQLNAASPPDILMVLRSLRAGKWLIAATVAGAVALAVAHQRFSEPVFVATAEVLLEGAEKKVVEFDAESETAASLDKAIATEARILHSPGLARKLVDEQSLMDDPEFNPMLRPPAAPSLGWVKMRLRQLLGSGEDVAPTEQEMLAATVIRTLQSIGVTNVPETSVFRVQVASGSPEKAARLANALVRLYIVNRLEAQFESSSQATRWLGEQVTALKADLEDSEARLKTYRASTQVLGAEALAGQNLRVKELRDRLGQSQAKIRQAEARIAALEALAEGRKPQLDGGLEGDPLLTPLLDRGDGAAREAARLISTIRAQMEREQRLAETLSVSVADLGSRIDRQSDELVRLQQLQREVDANASIYEFALARLRELSVERGVRRAGVQILSDAEPPLAPAGPGLPVVAALAAVVGGMLGAGLILVRKSVHDAFRTAEELETISGLPVVGQVPRVARGARRLPLKHITSDTPSLFTEAIRNLRTTILLNYSKKAKVIVLASALPGEGKTTVALALARSMSRIGSRVLLIDADLRRRSLGKMVSPQDEEGGLIEALLDGQPLEGVVVESEVLGADLLLCGSCVYNAADIFSFDEFRRLIEQAKADYDTIIIDTPPVLAVPDVRLIARCADILFLIVRWNQTTRLQLADAVRELDDVRAQTTGCILSQIDAKGLSRYGYGDRRGTYASFRAGYYQG